MDDLERRLRDSLTRNLQPVGAFSLAPERMRRARLIRMFAAVAAGLMTLAVAGSVATMVPPLFDRETKPAPGERGDEQAPTLVIVRCVEGGAEADTARVRPQPDGVHVLFRNEAGRRAFLVKPLGDEGSNEGGRLEPEGNTELTTAAPPGEMVIGCFDSDRDTPFDDVGDPRYARVTVVDPEGLWVSQELPCGLETSESRMRTDSPVDSDSDLPALARREVPGLRAEDVIREPGYPGTEWHLNAHVVLRDGEPVAHLAFVETPRDTWEISVRTCQGTEIGWRPFSRPT